MGLGRRTFAPGEVLTASNVMNYLMDQSVMNFAGTAARGSAIGTAVSEGMVSYLQDTDYVEVYRAVGTASPAWEQVAYVSDVTARSGLVPIIPSTVNYSGGTATANSLGEISFSAVTSISLNDVFSSEFTNYKIITNSFSATTSGTNINMRYRSAGTDNSSANYAMGGIQVNLNTTGGVGQSGGTSFRIVNGAGGIARNGFTLDVHSPADADLRTPAEWIGSGFNTDNQLLVASGVYNAAAAFDGFTIFPSAGNITGKIQIFGYKS